MSDIAEIRARLLKFEATATRDIEAAWRDAADARKSAEFAWTVAFIVAVAEAALAVVRWFR